MNSQTENLVMKLKEYSDKQSTLNELDRQIALGPEDEKSD